MDINNSNEQIKQSTATETEVLKSYGAYCSSCLGGWESSYFGNRT